MILSVAHALVDEPTSADVFGEWSNLVVGDRPQGLVDCYLVEGRGVLQVLAVWSTQEDHDRAIEEELNHPAFAVFEASGWDPTHTLFNVVGRLA